MKIMKLLAAGAMALAMTSPAAAQTVSRGDILVDAGIGIGVLKSGDNHTMFTQRIAAEYIIKDDLQLFGRNFAVGAGLSVTNGYCGLGNGVVMGIYDYDYYVYRYGWQVVEGRRQVIDEVHAVNRAGGGEAVAPFKRDDLTFLPQATLHYEPMTGLDVYVGVGIGLGLANSWTGTKTAITSGDFGSDNIYQTTQNNTQNIVVKAAYNDMDHAEWKDGCGTNATFAMAVYAGARYWLTDKFAANMQVGMLGGAIKKSIGSSYDLFSVGLTYRF